MDSCRNGGGTVKYCQYCCSVPDHLGFLFMFPKNKSIVQVRYEEQVKFASLVKMVLGWGRCIGRVDAW